MFWAAWVSEDSIWPRPMKITELNSRPLLLCTERMLGVSAPSSPSAMPGKLSDQWAVGGGR
jgi:hypothetical protein